METMDSGESSELKWLKGQLNLMTNTREDVQRQFELLYHRISQMKQEFDVSSNHSSSNSTDSENDEDDVLETITFKKSLGASEYRTDVVGRLSELENMPVEKDLVVWAENELCLKHNVDCPYIQNNYTNNSLSKTEVTSATPTGSDTKLNLPIYLTKDTETANRNCLKTEPHDELEEIHISQADGATQTAGIDFQANAKPNKSMTNEFAENKSELIQEKININFSEPTPKYNIKPRRPLHQKSDEAPASKILMFTAHDANSGVNKSNNATKSITTNQKEVTYIEKEITNDDKHIANETRSDPSKSDIVTNAETGFPLHRLVTTLSQPSDDDSDSVVTTTMYDQEDFSFINFKRGYVFFTVTADNQNLPYADSDTTTRDSESETETLSDTDSETDVGFLKFENGCVRFAAQSVVYSVFDFEAGASDNSYEDSSFSDNESLGLACLFDSEDIISDVDANNLRTPLECESYEYLDGLSDLFDESFCQFDNTTASIKSLPPRQDIGEADKKTVTEATQEDSVAVSAASLSQLCPFMNANETRNMRIEYSFTGVVLLNALPALLASSLASLLSNSSLSFGFYKPIQTSSCLSSSDFAKLSFSSQELPFTSSCGMPDNESNFDTLSTKSKESSSVESAFSS